jgi:hypothetical protein
MNRVREMTEMIPRAFVFLMGFMTGAYVTAFVMNRLLQVGYWTERKGNKMTQKEKREKLGRILDDMEAIMHDAELDFYRPGKRGVNVEQIAGDLLDDLKELTRDVEEFNDRLVGRLGQKKINEVLDRIARL